MAGNSNSEKKALIKDDLAISILSNSYNRLQRLSSEHTSAADNPIVSQIGYANALPMVGHLHIPWHGVVPRLYARSHPPQKKNWLQPLHLNAGCSLKTWKFHHPTANPQQLWEITLNATLQHWICSHTQRATVFGGVLFSHAEAMKDWIVHQISCLATRTIDDACHLVGNNEPYSQLWLRIDLPRFFLPKPVQKGYKKYG